MNDTGKRTKRVNQAKVERSKPMIELLRGMTPAERMAFYDREILGVGRPLISTSDLRRQRHDRAFRF